MSEIDFSPELLTYPPSHQGERAITLLSQLSNWYSLRDKCLEELELAHEEVERVVAKTAVGGERGFRDYKRAYDAIADAQQEVALKHDAFAEVDELIREAQKELSTTYDGFYLRTVFRAQQNDNESQGSWSEESEAVVEVDPDEALRGFQQHELLFKAMKDPSLPLRSKLVGEAVRKVTLVQAIARGAHVRKCKRSLNRARRFCDTECLYYQFYYWRAFTRGSVFRRRKLLGMTFRPLQANCNINSLRRGEFALRVTNARSIATLKRTFLMWYRYGKYLNAHVNDQTRERLVAFDTHMPEWETFLEHERRRVVLQRKGFLMNGSDPHLIKALYLTRWQRYVRYRIGKRERNMAANLHHEAKHLAKHFYAWMDIVAFSSQREATNFADLQLYFYAWRKQAHKQAWEERRVPLLKCFRKSEVLHKWRREALSLRNKRASGNLVLFASRRLVLHALYCWTGDNVRQKFIEAWLRWARYSRDRRFFKEFIGTYWARRARNLVGVCFRAWAVAVIPGLAAPEGTLFGTTAGVDEYKALKFRSQSNRLMERIHFCGEKIDALSAVFQPDKVTSDALLGIDPRGENIFSGEIPMASNVSLKDERRIRDYNFAWWSSVHETVPGDFPLLSQLLRLAAAIRRPNRKFIARTESEVRRLTKADIDATVVACTGAPIFDIDRAAVCVEALEHTVREQTSLAVVTSSKAEVREKRILQKADARITAMRLFNVSGTYSCTPIEILFTGFSPFRMVVEEHKQLRGRGPKGVPFAPPARKHQLPFLLRLHMQAYVQRRRHNIVGRTILMTKIARAVEIAKLGQLWVSNEATPAASSAKREAYMDGLRILEEKQFTASRATKLQRLVPRKYHTKIQHPQRPSIALMNLLGFNPIFLRGDLKQKVKLQKAMKDEMDRQLRMLFDLGLANTAYRRTNSELIGVRTVLWRNQLLDSLRIPSTAPTSPVGFGEDGDSEDSESRRPDFGQLQFGDETLETLQTLRRMDQMGRISPPPEQQGSEDDASAGRQNSDALLRQTSGSSAGSGLGRSGSVVGAGSPLEGQASIGGDGALDGSADGRMGASGGDPGSLGTSGASGPGTRRDDLDDKGHRGGGSASYIGGSGTHRGSGVGSPHAAAPGLHGRKPIGKRRGDHARSGQDDFDIDGLDLNRDYGEDAASSTSGKRGKGGRGGNRGTAGPGTEGGRGNLPVSPLQTGLGQSSHSEERTPQGRELKRRSSASSLLSLNSHRGSESGPESQSPRSINVSSLRVPKIKPRGPMTHEERLKKIQDDAARREERHRQNRKKRGIEEREAASDLGGSAQPDPLWRGEGPMLAAEKLLEVSGRYGNMVMSKSTEGLEDLKHLVGRLGMQSEGIEVGVDASAALDRLQGQDLPTIVESQESGPTGVGQPPQRASTGFSRRPLYEQKEVTFPYKPKGLDIFSEQPAVFSGEQRPQSCPTGLRPMIATNEVEPLVLEREPVRRQLLRLPRSTDKKGEYELMQSTAALVNESLGLGEPEVRLTETEKMILRRNTRQKRPDTDAKGGRGRVQQLRQEVGESKKTDSEMVEFVHWAATQRSSLLRRDTYDDAREEVGMSKQIITRSLSRHEDALSAAVAPADAAGIRALMAVEKRKLAIVKELLQFAPPEDAEPDLFEMCTRNRSLPSSISRIGGPQRKGSDGVVAQPLQEPELTDVEVGRLVSFIVQSNASE